MSKNYNEYLMSHKENVAKGFYWIQENVPELIYGDYDIERQIVSAHDMSKTDPDEYKAYDAYFYSNDQSYAVKEEYQKAWLRHIHQNPHHWQYWILTNDDPQEGEVILDIPHNYIIEMICDWWSFSWKQNNLYSIFKWYDDHKNYIKLSDGTKTIVEYILGKINMRLEELKNED